VREGVRGSGSLELKPDPTDFLSGFQKEGLE
jgi:hypothetical protein